MPNTLTQSYLEHSVWKPNLFKGKVAFITGGAVSTLINYFYYRDILEKEKKKI